MAISFAYKLVKKLPFGYGIQAVVVTTTTSPIMITTNPVVVTNPAIVTPQPYVEPTVQYTGPVVTYQPGPIQPVVYGQQMQQPGPMVSPTPQPQTHDPSSPLPPPSYQQ